jgi:hypothetical protein
VSAICIGCGCDELHGCRVPANLHAGHGGACWWLRFSAAEKLGVCSACEDLVGGWDSARQRAAILPLIAERYYRQVAPLYDNKADALAWLNTPQQILGDRAPRDLILAGELAKVQQLVDQLTSGAYA